MSRMKRWKHTESFWELNQHVQLRLPLLQSHLLLLKFYLKGATAAIQTVPLSSSSPSMEPAVPEIQTVALKLKFCT